MTKVLYVPLDDRPCNYHYPLELAEICDDIELVAPPFSMMGKLKVPADTEKLWQWIFDNADDAQYAVLSVDTLVYGNIIHSRIHQKTKEQIDAALSNFEKLKEKNPALQIHAFNLVARVAAYNNSFEDPDYWAEYGYAIWRYGYLQDKTERGLADEAERQELEQVTAQIAPECLRDFLQRREKGRYVNSRSVDFVHQGIFDHLVIPKDDTAEFGYAAADQSTLAKKILSLRLMDKIMIYPGADEVGSILFARVFNLIKKFSPRIYTRYSAAYGPFIVPRYEDRPIAEAIKAQATSMGGILVDTAAESDFLFAVHTPGKQMEECANQHNKDLTYTTHTNTHEFFRYIEYYRQTYGKPVALSDIAFANGSDIEMMIHANKTGILNGLCAYGGWNTSENTNGMCLAHADIHAYYTMHGFASGKEFLSTRFLATKVFEDYLFQAMIIPEAIREVEKRYPGRSPYYCADIHDEIASYMGERLRHYIETEFNSVFQGYHASIERFSMPWDRVYELHFALTLHS